MHKMSDGSFIDLSSIRSITNIESKQYEGQSVFWFNAKGDNWDHCFSVWSDRVGRAAQMYNFQIDYTRDKAKEKCNALREELLRAIETNNAKKYEYSIPTFSGYRIPIPPRPPRE